jgi:hypothetical protein
LHAKETPNPGQLWQQALSELQLQMTKATFDTWLANTCAIAFEDSTLTIGVASSFAKDWLENRLLTTVKRTLVGILGRSIEVKFVVSDRSKPAVQMVQVEPMYLSQRTAIVRPDRGIFVTLYSLQKWLPLLGPERWGMVQVLRSLCVDLPIQENGCCPLPISQQELAQMLERSRETINRWLNNEPIPGQKPWRKLTDKADPNGYLRLFIPRLKYRFERVGRAPRRVGMVLEVLMEDPLVPQDRQVMNLSESHPDKCQFRTYQDENIKLDKWQNITYPARNLEADKWQNVTHPARQVTKHHSNVNELTNYIGTVEKALTRRSAIRQALKPIVELTENLLEDYHSRRMFYKVLLALYPDHLELFTEAAEEAVAVGHDDPEANLGAIFVATLKELAGEAGVELGLGGSTR